MNRVYNLHMQILVLLSLISLPLGEAKANGLADAAVTIADQPLALYVNPALLTRTVNRNLLFNPVGFTFGTATEFQDIIPQIFDSYTNIGFMGYNQPLGDFGAGIAGFQDEEGARGLLTGAAYKLGFLHAGASLGLRYRENISQDETHFSPAFATGIAIPGIKLADVPGNISIAAAVRWFELFNIQAGIDYSIYYFHFLVNMHLRDLLQAQTTNLDGSVHLAALFDMQEIIDFPLEVGGGWGSDGRFGILTGADLNILRIILSYYKLPHPGTSHIGISVLFSVASTEEVEERLASIDKEAQEKSRITSNTYKSQGIDYYNQGDYEEAIHAFDVALVWDPTNEEALNWLQRVREEKRTSELRALLAGANAAIQSEDYLEAMNKAEAALAIDSTDSEAQKLASEAQQKFSQSVFSSTSSLRNSGEINALYEKGLEQYAGGDYKGAEETWNQIEKLAPKMKSVKVYKQKTSQKITESVGDGLRRLETLEKQGRWRDALNLASSLQKMVPANQTIKSKISLYRSKIKTLSTQYQSEGIDYYNRGYYVKAQKSFNAVLSLDPNHSTAKNYLERIKAKLQKKDVDEIYLQGVQAYTNHRYQEAVRYWEQVLKIDPGYQNATRNIQRAKEKLVQLK
ncbi:tetratricopeptide repeat protein [candidate division WOR-3 bacterium]|uniref:Tetratricopeptide repeat protein n=1 Tax=candidate division WOR-3 bacterium TaxID=2052148 RepID=A0A9D5K8W0_UNCW3|nr:tetratricopeptide repeat protein [candidate division WOR-3 bacterium]MBD3364235.1 tetratricopeptide repeat protein [candidate division WOR-3 bacterium]